MIGRCYIVSLLLAVAATCAAAELYGCNEAVCASVVSKCMLLKSCECNMKVNCTCCRDCYKCLHDLYTECCSCVGMCPNEAKVIDRLSKKSSVEDLNEPIPDLFNVLTEEADHLLRWVSMNFPQHEDLAVFQPASPHRATAVMGDVNCTAAFMSQCMSLNKCKVSCSSMGASKYRWFHDGCCECVGHTCINYGVNVSKCLQCPADRDRATEHEETDNTYHMPSESEGHDGTYTDDMSEEHDSNQQEVGEHYTQEEDP
ncbi:PREDICTED: twisted gastrulation protein homolog 1-A-like isoform X2 [Priapulus caudatus]|nr:PREDICTED: twisted gastrulation protein homolog 1-A-like isoform X2 [Priapulus caudatus]XP_014672226.1 PREDICTED: twisted gastrulation protein homolog 1-A-like isoform X2 [Priapulus caudatus]XP_014672234.1 PREDICTED: twisted gastrulation protein homolog 1-A-like isoform X2 [Priapulus caudatus]